MSKRANPTVIGVFVLVAVALVVTGILTLGGLQLFRSEMTWVAFFDGDVGGLAVGSPVLFRGAQVGQVTAIRIAFDPHNRIAVYGTVDPKRLPKGVPIIRTQKELQPAIDRGLRAQLRIVSLVTGQLSVSLDFLPETPVVLAGLEPGLPELPTVPTQLEQYQARLERILASLDKVDLAQLAQEVSETVRGIREVARSPELASAVRNASDAFRSADVALKRVDTQVAAVGDRTGATLDDTRELVRKIDREIEPLAASLRAALDDTRELVRKADREIEPVAASLRSALDATRTAAESAQSALGTINRALDGDTRLGDDISQALRQLTGAARSLNALADYLQRHPEALLRGKPGPDAK
jgi:paraquat-inducible protein B